MLNKWGIAAVSAMVAVIPVGFAAAALAGGNTPSSELAPLSMMLVAIGCGIIPSTRGSRWWLVVPVFATLRVCVVLLQMLLGE